MVKKEYWYKIWDFNSPSGKKLTENQMIKYAKKSLSVNKKHHLDRELKSKDLNRPINAWVYLKNIGVGVKTNRKIFLTSTSIHQ